MATEMAEENGDDISTAELHLMADGCVTMLKFIFGEENWDRWNKIKENVEMPGFQMFVSWLLDLADKDTNSDEKRLDDYGEMFYSEENNVKEDPEVAAMTQNNEETMFYSDGLALIPQTSDALETDDLMYQGQEVVEITYSSINNSFFCSTCQVIIGNASVVQSHVDLRHVEMPLTIICDCCGQTFSNMTDYILSHEEKFTRKPHSRKRTACTLCAKTFQNKQRLDDHIANQHEKTPPRYMCPICMKRVNSYDTFIKHRKRCRILSESSASSDLGLMPVCSGLK